MNLNFNLNNNQELLSFFKYLFQDEYLNRKAPSIISFFIKTRNYGLINFEENIRELYSKNNLIDLCYKAFQDGFKLDGMEFNNHNLIEQLIKNYYVNGFYFHSFPGVYQESIEKNGLLASNRNPNDDIFYKLADKYHFGDYFTSSNNRICVTELIDDFATHEYAIFTPEWLEMFLKLSGVDNIHFAYKRGNLEEMLEVANDSLNIIKQDMKKNPNYDENDYVFLEKYINDIISNRFKNGNNQIGIAFLEKKKMMGYFQKSIDIEALPIIEKIVNERNMDGKLIIEFITDSIASGQKTTDKNIPHDLVNILSYTIPQQQEKYYKTL